MVEVFIDGELVAQGVSGVALSYDAAEMSAIDSSRESYDVEVDVERSAMNAAIFGGEGFLHAAERFNAQDHRASVSYEGELVIEGAVILKSVVTRDGHTLYRLRIRRQGADWAHNVAVTRLSDSNIPFMLYMTVNSIKANWELDEAVQFAPVYRDCYVDSDRSLTQQDIFAARTVCDYYPFLSIRHIVESMFAGSQFEVVSRFMDEDLFKSLYMSGAYGSQNSTMARDSMDFLVKRLEDVSDVANSFGRVYMSPNMPVNSVGSVVDIDSIDRSDECFTRNNCFTQNDSGEQSFRPTTQVCVGFEMRLQYLCDYVIESRTKLKTFDTIYLHNSNMVSIDVLNRNEDLRGQEVLPNFVYHPIAFEATTIDQFRLVASIGGAETKSVIGEWTGRMGSITTPNVEPGSIGELQLMVWTPMGFMECDPTKDWALYYGAVEERGAVQIDLTLRTAPKSVTPDTPVDFNMMFVQGAEPGSHFTLLKGSSIRPTFATFPGEATWVGFEQLAQHRFSQADLLEALQQMFNLRVFIDHLAHKVYIDPAEWLYEQQQVWDWSDRVVSDEGALFEDRAIELHRGRAWGYQMGDGLINRYKTDYMVPGTTLPAAPDDDPQQSVEGAVSPNFGAWSVAVESSAARQSVDTTLNQIFSPSLSSLEGMLIVGDRDDPDIVDSFDFAPRIVMNLGTVESRSEEVPYLAFHTPQQTLCFEDRDGAVGLNRFYGGEVARDSSAQYVTLYLRLTTHDVVTLLSPTEGAPSIFSTFRLLIDGEWAMCRLVSIGEYELGGGRAKCKFLIVG